MERQSLEAYGLVGSGLTRELDQERSKALSDTGDAVQTRAEAGEGQGSEAEVSVIALKSGARSLPLCRF